MTNYYWAAYIFIPALKAILKWILCSSLVFLNGIVNESDISRGTRLPAHQHSNHVWFSHKATVPVTCCFEFWCPTVLHRGLTMDRKQRWNNYMRSTAEWNVKHQDESYLLPFIGCCCMLIQLLSVAANKWKQKGFMSMLQTSFCHRSIVLQDKQQNVNFPLQFKIFVNAVNLTLFQKSFESSAYFEDDQWKSLWRLKIFEDSMQHWLVS